MKLLRRLALLLLCSSISALPAWVPSSVAAEIVYIGTRGTFIANPATAAAAAPSQPPGIYAARLDERTGHLSELRHVMRLERAQWLLNHPKLPVIYAVANSSGGTGSGADSDIYSLAIDPSSGGLKVLNKVGSGGHDATYLSIDAASSTLFSANHGSDTGEPPPLRNGSASTLPVNPDGSLGEVASVQEDAGTGPNPRRQRTAQAHGVVIDPGGHYVLVADLGADRIFIHRFNASTRALTPVGSETLPPGSGPRHVIFHPNGKFVYLNSELSAQVFVFAWDAKLGQLHPLQTVLAYPADYSGKEEKSSAEFTLSHDARFAYLSLRGDQNSIVVYAVDRHAGTLHEIQRIATGGQGPRSFAIDPTGRWLLVTNDSDSVNELKVDRTTGKLSATQESLSVPKPATVIFYAR
jgi:6-phosphogluconolactonase